MPLSDSARKLLKHFQDKHLQPTKYEHLQVMRDLFGDAEIVKKPRQIGQVWLVGIRHSQIE